MTAMKLLHSPTLMATVIATVVGTFAWSFGLVNKIWPAHPFFADLLISLITVVVVKEIWKREFSR
jgi:hypothetical protein